MQRCMLLSKLHRAVVTELAPDYEGSLTIPKDLAEKAGILSGERVLVANIANAARFWTYAMLDDRPGRFCLNGAAARLGSVGDRIIVFTFAWMTDEEAAGHRPRVVVLDESNRVVGVEGPGRAGPSDPGGRE